MQDPREEVIYWSDVFTPFLVEEFGYEISFGIRPKSWFDHLFERIVYRRGAIPYGGGIYKGKPTFYYHIKFGKPLVNNNDGYAESHFLHDMIHLWQMDRIIMADIRRPFYLPQDIFLSSYRMWFEGLAELYTFKILNTIYLRVRQGKDTQGWSEEDVLDKMHSHIHLHLNVLFTLGFNEGYISDVLERVFELCGISQEARRFLRGGRLRDGWDKKWLKVVEPYTLGLYYLLRYAEERSMTLRDLLEVPILNKELKK